MTMITFIHFGFLIDLKFFISEPPSFNPKHSVTKRQNEVVLIMNSTQEAHVIEGKTFKVL